MRVLNLEIVRIFRNSLLWLFTKGMYRDNSQHTLIFIAMHFLDLEYVRFLCLFQWKDINYTNNAVWLHYTSSSNKFVERYRVQYIISLSITLLSYYTSIGGNIHKYNFISFVHEKKPSNNLPPLGTYILRCRQSSDSWMSFGCILLKYCRRLRGMRVMASEAFEILGNACGQTGPWLVAGRTPDQWTGGRVGANLKRINNAWL